MAQLTNRDKITIFLSLLGPEVAARVLKYLPDELARLAAAGIERLPQPPAEAVQTVLEEFNRFYLSSGDEVRSLPGQARSDVPADPLENAIRRLGLAGFWKVLAGEDLTNVAFILANLPPRLSQGLMNSLDAAQRQTIEDLNGKLRKTPLAAQVFAAFRSHLLEKFAP